MRILNVFGFFGILCINSNQFLYATSYLKHTDLDVVIRKCKNLNNLSPLLRLKNHLFCDYDNTINSNYPQMTNVTLNLTPKLIEFEDHNAKLFLHSWMSLYWQDSKLTWKPSDYDDITFIQIKSWQIWMPQLTVHNSVDLWSDILPVTGCLLYNSGHIYCVPAVKLSSLCNTDSTYWPYDSHECSITFFSKMLNGENIDLSLLNEDGVTMSEYMDDMTWDFKFINSVREAERYMCCPNDTYIFPRITYNFLLTRHHGKIHSTITVPAIALILLTLTVLCLDLNSVERITVASVNFICHLLCLYILQWSMPYNGANPPNIMFFYRESLVLATFAIILTALLRKLEDMSTEIPNWISFTITFVLNYKVGRFLISKRDESKMAGKDTVIEGNSNVPKSKMSTKELSWKHFAAIIDWLSFFCVIIIYVIILIILIPS